MRGISQELIILALIGAAWLIQWAMRFVRGRTVPAPVARVDRDVLPPPVPPTAASSWPAGVAGAAAVPGPQPGPRARAGRSNRFARGALLGNRRTMQDAVVVAAILGRCHAYRR